MFLCIVWWLNTSCVDDSDVALSDLEGEEEEDDDEMEEDDGDDDDEDDDDEDDESKALTNPVFIWPDQFWLII